MGTDELQDFVGKALAVPGGDTTEFTPGMPSLRRAATDHPKTFRDYHEASPDWHVFIEQGNRFAARRWSYGGNPRMSFGNGLHERLTAVASGWRYLSNPVSRNGA